MKKKLLLLTAVMAVATVGAVPVYSWDFDNPDAKNRHTSSGSNTGAKLLAVVQTGKGYKNSSGVVCSGKNAIYGRIPMDWKNYTIEFKFCLNGPVKNGKTRGLFNYEFWSWNRRSCRISIDNRKRLEFMMISRNPKKNAPVNFHFYMVSDPVDWQYGKWYTFRLTASAGGSAKIYLDGKLLAARNGARGLDELNDLKKPEYRHLIRMGWDTSTPLPGHNPLEGVIDDLKLWNKVVDPGLLGGLKKDAAQPREAQERLLIITDKKAPRAWSSPFYVADRAGNAYGEMLRADDKFVKAAGKGAIAMDKEFFYVTVHCPVPQGMKVGKSGKSLWRSDYIEFFLRPRMDSTVYYQYCAGTNGLSKSYRYIRRVVEDTSFKSKAVYKITTSDPRSFTVEIKIPKAEVGCAGLGKGAVITGNFGRGGKTSGGFSGWVPVKNDFHVIDSYGKMILGSKKDYFIAETEKLRKLTRSKEILKSIAALRDEAIKVDSPVDLFDNAVNNINAAILSERLKGMKTLVWKADVWRNDFNPGLFRKPLKSLRVVMAQNSRYIGGFAVSNLTKQPWMGRIKCLQHWPMRSPGKKFVCDTWSDFQANIKFYEALPTQTIGGNFMYDALYPTPLSLFRITPGGTVPVFFTVSSKGLKPGIYKTKIVIYPSYMGFSVDTVDLEVEILPVDLAAIKVDSFHYAFFTERAIDEPNYRNMPKLYKALTDQEANVMFAGHLREVYPDTNDDGSIKKIDFTAFDKKIQAWIDSGVKKEDVKLLCNLYTFILIWRDAQGKYHGCKHRYGTPKWEKAFKQFMKALYAHVEKKFNIPPERLIIYTGDEPSGDINDPKSKLYRVNYLAKLIKSVVPRAGLATNPMAFKEGLSKRFLAGMEELCKTHTHLILVRFYKTPQILAMLKKHKVTLWTYDAVNSTAAVPAVYRTMFSESFRNRIGASCAYWAIDSYAGDGFNPDDVNGNYNGGYSTSRIDYGSMYCDANLGEIIPSRRSEAHYQGLLDFKALKYCQNLIDKRKDKAVWQKKLDDIAKRMHESLHCGNMDELHTELLRMIVTLKK